MNKNIVRQVMVVISLIGTLLVNFLANALPINGQTSAEVANRLPIYFVPANYVFSIWGVLYMLLIAYTVYQALPSQRENQHLRRIGYLFVLSSIANTTWLVLFHYEYFPLTMVAMVTVLSSLIAIYLRLDIGKTSVSRTEHWLVRIPFSVYLGWITVATIANASYVLYDANWDGFGLSGPIWTVIMLMVATAVTLTIIIRRRDIAYTAVIVWALVGIIIKQTDTPLVAVTAGLMTVVVISASLIVTFWRRSSTVVSDAST
jgi:tryptophan-rich sensory protein